MCLKGSIHQFKVSYTMHYSPIFGWYTDKNSCENKVRLDTLGLVANSRSNDVVVKNLLLFPT